MKRQESQAVKVTVLYVGTSLLAPLRRAEQEIDARHLTGFTVAAHNCGGPLSEDEWGRAQADIITSSLVFVIHITDSENSARIAAALDEAGGKQEAVIAFNCMPDLMRRTRMGKLEFRKLMKPRAAREDGQAGEASSRTLVRKLGSWMADFMKGRGANPKSGPPSPGHYVELIKRLPAILRFVPSAGRLRDVKNYLYLFCYFLQPTPKNIRSMLLYAVKHYVEGYGSSFKVDGPEAMPATAIYHPDAQKLFETFEAYRKWHERRRGRRLDPARTIGLLVMRPQVIGEARRHYDGLIRAIEDEGLSVIAAISTFMDNRESCSEFFVEQNGSSRARVSQIVSLTGFSFVGGPAMNDSAASVEFFRGLGVPYRSMVSLDMQTIESWEGSRLGLNPIQTAMQVAIPEIDGATEPFVFGGLPERGNEPEPLADRCRKIARRLSRWNRLRAAPSEDVRLAVLLFCFPPNKGNIGTAADLDAFASLWEILSRLKGEGYKVDLPPSVDCLRERVLEGNSDEFGMTANVAYRMSVDEYRSLCRYVDEIESEWGRAPGSINSNGSEVLILGVELGNVFVGVQPTFGYEGDPMRLLAAESGGPHHGFMALYTYIEKVFRADAVIHLGTHGSTEFMPGKQAGLSSSCWPDRLMGELPNVYIYSVNNPSEGTIARRRSYAELVSYLTPPIENAGLYRELASLKEMLAAYRQSKNEREREQLFEAIEEKSRALNL